MAEEFTRLFRNAVTSPGADHCQHEWACHLNLELQKVVTNIRKLTGFSRFLLPPLFPDLRRAAWGHAIIVNASKYGCDALVVLPGDRDPLHIPLQITQEVRDL